MQIPHLIDIENASPEADEVDNVFHWYLADLVLSNVTLPVGPS